MKTNLKLVWLVQLLLSLGLSVFAQGTAFTYQGRLNDAYGPANGSYDLSFTLFNTGSGPSQIGSPITNSATSVSNGLFVVKLDFGNGVFNGTNYWLEIAVQTNGGVGFTTLAPRQPVTPTPYAIYAEGASNVLGTISAGQLSGSVGNNQLANNSVTVTAGTGLSGGGNVALGGTVTLNNTGVLSVSGSGVTVVPTNGNVVISAPLGGDLSGTPAAATVIGIQQRPLAATAPTTGQVLTYDGTQWTPQIVTGWQITGNLGTTAGVNFVGTADNQPLDFRVNNQRAFRLEPSTNGESPNVVGGSSINYVGSGVGGVVIGGGGTYNWYGFPTLNFTNRIGSGADFGVIGGGYDNAIMGNGAASCLASTIGGGARSTILSSGSTVSGGFSNSILASAANSVISGGFLNTIQTNSYDSTISGGYCNTIQTNSYFSSIGGGYVNTIQANAYNSTISGGNINTIQTNSSYSTIGGGYANTIRANAAESTIAGGDANTIQAGANSATIGGGLLNTNQDNTVYSTIAGGYLNLVQTNASDATISGGVFNTIQVNAYGSTIGGGSQNVIQTYGFYSTIGGGIQNLMQAYVQNSTIAGGFSNSIGTAATETTIGGGYNNLIQSRSYDSTIAGGAFNQIGSNYIAAVIGGGKSNVVKGSYAVVPGGTNNLAGADYSFAAGRQAKAIHPGAFVWADSQPADFSSTATNQFAVRASGGVSFVTGGAGVLVDGQSLFYGNNGSSLLNVNAALLNGLPSSAFAAASGSANYIQNQSTAAQSASFSISGNASIGGAVAAGSASVSGTVAANNLVVTNSANVSGNVTGNNLIATNSLQVISGDATIGGAITAASASVSGTVAANNLSVTNSIQITGAASNTPTPVFIHFATAGSIPGLGAPATVISNPQCDGNPNAILIVTPNRNASGGIDNPHPFAVDYNGTNWRIYNTDIAAMPVGTAFNVLVFKP